MKEEILFIQEKSTKNTMRYLEIPAEGKPFVLRNLYLQNFHPLSKETVIRVTIEETGLTVNQVKK